MTELQRAKIVIDVTVDGDTAHLKLTSSPMIPALRLADMLESAAREIRAGRLDALEVRPIET